MQFENILSQPDPKEDLGKIVDPRLGDDCPLDSVCKVKFPSRMQMRSLFSNLIS